MKIIVYAVVFNAGLKVHCALKKEVLTVASPGFCVRGHRFGVVKRPKIINVCRTTPGSTVGYIGYS